MKYILFILMISTFSINAQDKSKKEIRQEKREARNAKRQEKKNERKGQEMAAIEKVNGLLMSKEWVLEAVTVQGKRGGQVYNLNPNLNFVSVNSEEEAIVQLSFNNLIGWNGVGGITLEGKIGKYEYSSDKKSLNITMSAMGSGLGVVDMFITVSGDGNGRASISGNWGDRITFQGKFVSLEESTVYKGTTTY